ncbi:MAG: type III PLP-dependent enzyme [Spirochaetota bacterium]
MAGYTFPLERFGGRERLDRVKAVADGRATPCLYVDLDMVESQYRRMREALPYADVFYAVKANPMREVVALLAELGSSFDIASRYELDFVLSLGVSPDRVSYGNTIKKRSDIAYAYERGVRLFACDAPDDVRNLAEHAPGARVFFRVFTQGTGSDWPLSRKFGAHPDMILEVAELAKELGLEPYGISFHVGSQQRDIGEWDEALARTKLLFDDLERHDITLGMVNLGGGFPANYLDPARSIEVYAQEITRFLTERFGEKMPRVIAEPGRYLVADAGVLVSEIILLTKKARNNLYRWVYMDAGLFGGLIEAIGEAIKYPIYFDGDGEAEEIILAGPTCDSMDILYETHKYAMPAGTTTGDRVYIFATGAYTHTYSSVAFNGFPPLETATLPRDATRVLHRAPS